MRRTHSIFIIVLVLALLCSCTQAGLFSGSGSPSADSSGTGSSSPTDITGEAVSPSPSQAPAKVDNEARFALFRAFLSENYQGLSGAFYNGISGVGFIDLDIDGGVEMLVFDAGASAAMGLQFFDIIGGEVECVSANMDDVGTLFGGKHMSRVSVNANYFDDFRLMQDKASGGKFFIVQSGNGAADFSYSELVRFGNDEGVLTLESLMYKYEEFDIDSGDLKSESFKITGKDAGKSEYEAAYSSFFAEAEDMGYVAMGAFLWENSEFEAGLDGLLAMADKARFLYFANSFLIV